MKKPEKNFNLTLISSLILSSIAFTACGGSSSSPQPGPTPDPDPEKVKITLVEQGDIFTGKPYVVSITEESSASDTASDANTEIDGLTVTAKYGEITKTHPQTGKEAPAGTLYYYVPENVLGQTEDFYNINEEITITNKAQKSSVRELNFGTKYEGGDPIFTDSWNIKNLGQNPFKVAHSPLKGIDLNVIPAWHLTDSENNLISGKGVLVGVTDTAVDIEHEDLINKVHHLTDAPAFINPGITLEDVLEDEDVLHGTGVSGIIAAEANNGKGLRGIAFDADILSYDMNRISSALSITSVKGPHLYNASIGLDSSYDYSPDYETAFQIMFENNIPFIKASGNEFDGPDLFDDDDDDDDDNNIFGDKDKPQYPIECREANVECQYNELSSLNRGRYNISVTGINSLGKKASYASSGSFVWVAGAAGESGYDNSSDSSAANVSTLSRFSPKKYDDWDAGTPWRTNKEFYNIRKFYTHKMNGTSAATPSVTGVASLVKQAKPDLTVPQLRYIFATTSNNDLTSGWSPLAYEPQVVTPPEYAGEKFTADLGWYENGAGLRFSNHFGFGVVNAAEAVKKALTCNDDALCAKRSALPEDFVSTNENPCTSDDGGRNVTCIFTGFVNADDHEKTGNRIEIEETSINLSSFRHLRNSEDPELCAHASGEDLDKITPEGLIFSSFNLQIDMTSPDNTRTLIKPIYTLWDYNADIMKDLVVHSPDYGFDFLVHNSSYFTETFTPTDKFTVKFRSKCSIDVDTLNKNIYVLIGGYAE